MKVILATPNFHQPRGNTITVQRIADGLEASGVETDIVSITENSAVTSLPEADLIHGFNAYRFYTFMQGLDKKPDTYMVTLTGTDINHALFDQASRNDVVTCLKNAAAIHVFNEEAKQTLVKEVPEVKKKIFLIPQGSSDFSDRALTFEKEENTCLFVLPAGIRQVKNVPGAIEMLHSLYEQHNQVRLWIVGPILEEAEGELVKNLIEKHADWIQYLGEVPHSTMGAIYSSADIVINTSYSEGQSSAILEAMGHGLPVLVSGNEGNRSIVEHEQTGFVYDNTNQFLDYAAKIMNNYELRQTIGSAARRYIAEHHSSSHETEHLLKIYQNIIK